MPTLFKHLQPGLCVETDDMYFLRVETQRGPNGHLFNCVAQLSNNPMRVCYMVDICPLTFKGYAFSLNNPITHVSQQFDAWGE